MFNKKRTCLLPVGVVSVISKYVNHHSSCSTCIICGKNQNESMNGNQQGITPSELMSLWLFSKIACNDILGRNPFKFDRKPTFYVQISEISSSSTGNRTVQLNFIFGSNSTVPICPGEKTTFRAIYDAMDSVPADPVNNKEYWFKNSIINYAMLLINGPTMIPIKSEEDLLYDAYNFIITSKQLSNTNNEKKTESTASSGEINKDRLIGSLSKINRKIAADHADLVFKYLTHELGCVEIGMYNKGPTRTKELQEFKIKTPIMLKSFILHLVKDYKTMPNNLKVIAFVISGMYISAQVMTCNKESVVLVGTSQQYHMPESPAEVPKLLPPVLKLIYNCAMTIKITTSHLKAISSSVSLDEDSEVYIPPCFAGSNNKRTYVVAFSD